MQPKVSQAVELRPALNRVTVRLGSFFAGRPVLRAACVALAAALAHHAARFLLSPAMFFNAGWVVYWPLNAIAVAIMLMVPRSYWPSILIGITLSEAQSELGDEGLFEMSFDALANLLEIAIPIYFLPPFKNLADWMGKPRLISRFMLFALCLSPIVSSIPAGYAQAVVHHRRFLFQVVQWSSADILGTALFLPLVLALASRETYDLFRPNALARTLSLLGLTCLSSWLVFYQSPFPFPFVIMPTLLLIVFQLGFSGAVLAVNCMTIIASAATLHGHGPFDHLSLTHPEYSVIMLQLYLTLCMLMSLPISVLLLQRRQFETELKQAYFRMEAIATLDGLTGVANRRRFDTTLETEWRRARRHDQPLSLLMIDVDHFKRYNDTYGHVAGDQCLRQVAAALTTVPLRGGDLVARYGGEEFIILLPGDDAHGALHIAELTRTAIEALQIEHSESPSSRVTVSIGCGSLVPNPSLDPSMLIEGADRALYRAKQEGRNRVQLWLPDMTQPAQGAAAPLPTLAPDASLLYEDISPL